MKILIVSDTHRKDGNLQWVMEKEKPFDMLIHLGDAEGSEQYIAHWAEPGCELEMVLGNNDFFSHLERERDLMIGKYKTLLTHGHYYHVSLSTEYLKEEARSRDFDIAMFGHTHRPSGSTAAILQTKRALRSFPSAPKSRSMIFLFLIS